MTAPAKGTAVAKRDEKKDTPALSPERAAKIEEARARTAVAKAIRGSIWGKDLHPTVLDAVIAYCRQNNLDAVRHVEVLGGRIYLTAQFYDEKGAPLLHSGEVAFDEPDYINADPRLDEDAKAGDEWAAEEGKRRRQLRIKYNAPEAAKATVLTRARLRAGMTVIGVNWCGGIPNGKKDPVGDAEPTKTAQTRSRRRAWVQIADALPNYGAIVKPIQESAKTAIPVLVVDPPSTSQGASFGQNLGGADDPYLLDAGAKAEDEDLREDRAIVEREGAELPLNDRRARPT